MILLTAILGVIATVSTGACTVMVAKLNNGNDRQKFYEDKIVNLINVQSEEIKQLKIEIEVLTSENRELQNKVFDLTLQLEKRNSQ